MEEKKIFSRDWVSTSDFSGWILYCRSNSSTAARVLSSGHLIVTLPLIIVTSAVVFERASKTVPGRFLKKSRVLELLDNSWSVPNFFNSPFSRRPPGRKPFRLRTKCAN